MNLYLIIALGLSMAANAFLGDAYLHQRDKTAEVKTETVFVTAAAKECSKGTEALATGAVKSAKEAAPKRAAAKAADVTLSKQADAILARAPAVPGDTCKSAEAEVDAWWGERTKP